MEERFSKRIRREMRHMKQERRAARRAQQMRDFEEEEQILATAPAPAPIDPPEMNLTYLTVTFLVLASIVLWFGRLELLVEMFM
jgi:hypothetical protein